VLGAGLILIAGEALIELVPAGDGTLAAHPGGGPFNTARALGRLERPVAYLGRISTDRFGAELTGELAADASRARKRGLSTDRGSGRRAEQASAARG
jgi:sugar/nucleoside kinase (ribokinase family)